MRPIDVKKTTIVGIFIIICFAIFSTITLMLGKDSGLIDRQVVFHTIVDNAEGLRTGAAVNLRGVKVGSIESIEFQSIEKLQISIKVGAKYTNWIKKDSYLTVKTQGMLGDNYLEILGGSEETAHLQAGEFLETRSSGFLKELVNKSDNILENANFLLTSVNQLLSEMNQDKQIAKTITNLNQLTVKLNHLMSPEFIKNINYTFSQFSQMSEQINKGPGTIHSFLYDPTVYYDLQTLLGGAQRNKVLKYFVRESINKAEEIKK